MISFCQCFWKWGELHACILDYVTGEPEGNIDREFGENGIAMAGMVVLYVLGVAGMEAEVTFRPMLDYMYFESIGEVFGDRGRLRVTRCLNGSENAYGIKLMTELKDNLKYSCKRSELAACDVLLMNLRQ